MPRAPPRAGRCCSGGDRAWGRDARSQCPRRRPHSGERSRAQPGGGRRRRHRSRGSARRPGRRRRGRPRRARAGARGGGGTSRREPYHPPDRRHKQRAPSPTALSLCTDSAMLLPCTIRCVMKRLAIVAMLLLVGCRGREPAPGVERDAAILTARTLGLAYLQRDQLAEAETSFRRIVALAPDQALGYANVGLVQLRQGRYREAETAIRRAAALDTANDDIALTLGKVYELTGRSAAARAEVDRVLRRSPHDLRALYALVQLDSASRESYLRQIVERAPANVAARLELADLLLAHGAADPAAAQLEALQRQLPELPREATRFFERALALARAGRAAAAAAPAARFHRFMETTAAYQASLQKLQGTSGAAPPAGYPILTFNPIITPPAQDARAIAAAIRFVDVTTAAGLVGLPPLPDTAGGSALAIGDYDGDGSEDVFVGGHLFQNGLGRAADATTRAGIHLRDRAISATFGDYDNDGRLDLYVATAGGGVLLRNAGDSTFTDVTTAAGLGC